MNQCNTLKLDRSKVISKLGLGRWLTPAACLSVCAALLHIRRSMAGRPTLHFGGLSSLFPPPLLVRPLQLDLFFWLPRDREGNIVVRRETVQRWQIRMVRGCEKFLPDVA